MATLGVPYRLGYTSKTLVSGLTNVNAMVSKANGVVAGPIILSEMGPPFQGMYAANLITSPSDPEGEWFVVTRSPNEGVRLGSRISFAPNYGLQNQGAILALGAQITGNEVIGEIDQDLEEIIGIIDADELVGLVVKEEPI